MLLPKLKVLQDTVVELQTCIGKDNCKTCVLYNKNGGRCGGCTPKTKEDLEGNFQSCYQTCHECTGYRTTVTAICCRSPLKDIYLKALTRNDNPNVLKYKFKQRPALSFKTKAILNLVFGSPTRILAGSGKDLILPNNTEVVATSLSFVSGMGSGFFSTDLKSYLKLPHKAKLVLTTMSIDDHLERAWDHERYGSPECERAGIDYWMPLAFSSYGHEANMHAYYQFLRTMWSLEKGRGWFFPGDIPRVNLKLDDIAQQGMEACPQVMFNVQFQANEENLRLYISNFKWWHNFAPRDVSFWFVGATTPTLLHNVRKVCAGRDLYWLSGKPMYNAVNGKVLLANGRERKVDASISKLEILEENMKVFEEMVKKYS